MKLTIVGCSGSMSGPDSAASAYLLQAEHEGRTTSVLFDCGPGAMGALLRHMDPFELDAVVLSHLHADHVVDVIGMHVYRRWYPGGNCEPLPVYGPAGTLQRIRDVGGDGPEEDYHKEFEVRTIATGSTVDIGPLTITAYDAEHPIEAYGLRVDGPSTARPGERARFAYTGDTDLCETQVAMATEADLLLSEAAFQACRDTVRGIHLTGERAGQLAAQSRSRHLVLTHIQPWTDPETVRSEASSQFDGEISVAKASETYLI